MLVELRNDGKTILLSTHMLDSVSEFWDSTHIMVNGEIAASRTRNEVIGSGEDLEKLFFEITENNNEEVVS